ncbi:2Fe-2S iron-sulfur cluster-binding protein [Streptomyces ochraceiscleroticus]|uniref:2Fe-2S iron-sulfur cluster-binding protein n=1 Tax=Streptomyces ochraceiscleroticus TaxID=47761 RepID=A0ABW1MTD5_9ACTN|nr:2Fe-2S iron-sulfur cluster binding domain-containing protein [Streptomyces ochraceiscleroticus]
MTHRTEHTVSVDGSDVRFACSEGDTLLRAALRAGVGLSYECNSGSCGSCRYELLEGEVRDRRPDAPGLTARDRRKHRRLACQSEPLTSCTVRLGAKAESAPHRPLRQTATLREIRPLTHDMSEFVFVTGRPAAFSPGQYAMLLLPEGQVERAYSMSNVGNCYGEWRFVVKRAPGGEATSILFDKLEVGARVVLDGPYGHAYLRRDNPHAVCVGGGSGVGAMISVLLGAAALPDADSRTVHLFLGGRSPADLFRPAALELAQSRLGALHFHTAVSGTSPDGAEALGTGGSPYRGFLHEAVLDVLGDTLTDFTFYAAGPPAMTDALARTLVLEKGLTADQLHFDRFC